MGPPPARERNPAAKRARIASAALELFQTQGYAATTIDQIAEAAGVGRRTVFDHFASKDAILFDQLLVRREVLLERLRTRPDDEPPLRSLHAVLRALAKEGFDRSLLEQILGVLKSDAKLGVESFSIGSMAFEKAVVAELAARNSTASTVELHALTQMAFGWFVTAIRMYFKDGRRTLLRYFDDAVKTCTDAIGNLA